MYMMFSSSDPLGEPINGHTLALFRIFSPTVPRLLEDIAKVARDIRRRTEKESFL